MNKSTVEQIIREFKGHIDDLGAHLYHELEAEKTLRAEKTAIQQEKIKAQNIYDEAQKRYKTRLADLQSRCKHYETSWHDDPSGGNDSYTECCLCGKQW